jgi:lipoyl(octanoyl) transferase
VGLLTRALEVRRLGLVPYTEAWALQNELHERRVARDIGDTLLLLEHPHVYTIGRRGTHDDVLRPDVEVVETDRGGQVTYHGPGQLVGYPIVDLGPAADLVGYVRRLEDVMIRALERFDIEAGRDPGNTGVWVGNAKIGAIGVRVTRNVTKHGFALNVSTDLSYFAGIIPCGITDKGVTSMHVLGSSVSVDEVADVVAEEFAKR